MKNNRLVLLQLLCCLTGDLCAQITVGPNNPSVSSNSATIGVTAWSNTGNVFASDNSRANATALILGDNSNYLVATGFGFAVPAASVITGITVEMEKRGTGLLQQVNDNSVKIVQGGVISGTEHALGGTWPGGDAYFSYGGAADLWGLPWTYSDINAANFGVAISASLAGLSVLPSAQIDHIRISVQYTITLAADLAYFTAACAGEGTFLSWTAASQSDNDYFTVERTTNGTDYEVVGTVQGAGSTDQAMDYSMTDSQRLPSIAYYRLEQTDFDGQSRYYNPVTVDCSRPQCVVVFPNPASDAIKISFNYFSNEHYSLRLYDPLGGLVESLTDLSSGEVAIARNNLENGCYFVELRTEGQLIATEKLILQ